MKSTPPSDKVHLRGSHIKALRKHKGWKQITLADRAGISVATVKRVERAESYSAESQTWKNLATALEVDDPNELLVRSESTLSCRDVSGSWKGGGKDIELPGYLTYDLSWRYTLELEISQSNEEVEGTGTIKLFKGRSAKPRFEFPFSATGRVVEENYVFFNFVDEDRVVNGYGSMLYYIAPDGQSMEGYALGRDKGQSSSFHFVLSHFTLERVVP